MSLIEKLKERDLKYFTISRTRIDIFCSRGIVKYNLVSKKYSLVNKDGVKISGKGEEGLFSLLENNQG